MRKKIWILFEHPESSAWAKLTALVSCAFVLVSVVTFCLETLPENRQYAIIFHSNNYTMELENIGAGRQKRYNYEKTKYILLKLLGAKNFSGKPQKFGKIDVAPVEVLGLTAPFFTIETFSMLWFSIEIFLRFCASPSRLFFFASIMNIIDLVSYRIIFSILNYLI